MPTSEVTRDESLLVGFVVLAVLGFAVIAGAFLRKIAIEERFLREAFPGDYDRYQAEVAALIPLVY